MLVTNNTFKNDFLSLKLHCLAVINETQANEILVMRVSKKWLVNLDNIGSKFFLFINSIGISSCSVLDVSHELFHAELKSGFKIVQNLNLHYLGPLLK